MTFQTKKLFLKKLSKHKISRRNEKNKDESKRDNRKTTEKIIEAKCWFVEINKIAEPLVRQIKGKII